MTQVEIKKLQAHEARLWLNLHEAEYDLAVLNMGMDYFQFQELLKQDAHYGRKLWAWCSVRDFREDMGIEQDLNHPDANKAFEISQKVWELTSHN